jgi:predicted Zn-dependent protease
MRVLAELSSGPRQPEFLSTHPHPESRIEQIERLLASDYAAQRRDPAYVTGADRFRRDFLDPLSTLPAPAHRPAPAATASSWCAHCAGAPETALP